jgi:RNA polymerase sigma-70 factor (ECF subfamily)
MVIDAGRNASTVSRRALSELCAIYWYPLYSFVRRRGLSAEDAQDLTQEFFTELLDKETLRVADRERGRFRTFLLAAVTNFLAKQRRKAGARKRGGGRAAISLDLAAGEKRYLREPFHTLTAEKIYERRWAMTLLEQVLAGLKGEASQAGKLRQFELLAPYLGGSRQTVPYATIAGALQMTEGAVKVAVHRLRQRCRDRLRAEIAQTVADAAEIDEELRELFAKVRQE